MPIYMIGEGTRHGPPFNRTFFNTRIAEIISRTEGTPDCRLSLFLTDGGQLEVKEIVELTDAYLVIRAFREEDDQGTSLHVIPYGGIYRLQVSPRGSDRVGFVVPARRGRRKSR